MKRFVIILGLISIFLLSGCVSLTVTQELDSKPDNKLIISAKVSDNSDIRSVSDAIKEINCKFKAEESKKETDTYLTYTSDNCVLSGVTTSKLDKNVYKYTFDSSTFEQYSSKITDATYIIKIAGKVIDTNGINIGDNQVKFLISSDDITNKYVYFVEYSLYCKYDSECTFDEACINSECTKLNCEDCQYIEDHKCKSYGCCSDNDCKGNQRCEEHNCIDMGCEYNQHAENHVCVWNCVDNSNCKESEECKDHNCYELDCAYNEGFVNHECNLLNCGLFKKTTNHQCVNNPLVITLIGTVALLMIFVAVFLYWNHAKKHKKRSKK